MCLGWLAGTHTPGEEVQGEAEEPGEPKWGETAACSPPRPCAMVVPDFELICEIMLVAEGFLEARLLARKFITLYTLCKELLSKQVCSSSSRGSRSSLRGLTPVSAFPSPEIHSEPGIASWSPWEWAFISLSPPPQDHYDWGLRAIKSVLVVAGSLKRGDPTRAEDQVLMRALRDFNIPKIVTDDLPVFMGLIGDLFPALDVPRKRDLNFEKVILAFPNLHHPQRSLVFVTRILEPYSPASPGFQNSEGHRRIWG